MPEYDPRAELMGTQQSLLKEYECEFNREIEENVAILSHPTMGAGWRMGTTS